MNREAFGECGEQPDRAQHHGIDDARGGFAHEHENALVLDIRVVFVVHSKNG